MAYQTGLTRHTRAIPLSDTMPPKRAKQGIINSVFTVPKFDQEYRDSFDSASDWLTANYGHTQYADCPNSLQSIVGKGACEPALRTN